MLIALLAAISYAQTERRLLAGGSTAANTAANSGKGQRSDYVTNPGGRKDDGTNAQTVGMYSQAARQEAAADAAHANNQQVQYGNVQTQQIAANNQGRTPQATNGFGNGQVATMQDPPIRDMYPELFVFFGILSTMVNCYQIYGRNKGSPQQEPLLEESDSV